MAAKHTASTDTSDAFFHGLGHSQLMSSFATNDGSASRRAKGPPDSNDSCRSVSRRYCAGGQRVRRGGEAAFPDWSILCLKYQRGRKRELSFAETRPRICEV